MKVGPGVDLARGGRGRRLSRAPAGGDIARGAIRHRDLGASGQRAARATPELPPQGDLRERDPRFAAPVERPVPGGSCPQKPTAGDGGLWDEVKPAHIHEIQRIDKSGDWIRRLQGRGWKVIYVGRTDRIRQGISVLRGEPSGHRGPPRAPGRRCPGATGRRLGGGRQRGTSALTRGELAEVGSPCSSWERCTSFSGGPHREPPRTQLLEGVDYMDVNYELAGSAAHGPPPQVATVARAWDYLGIEPSPVPVSSDQGLSPDAQARSWIQDDVTNWDEIAAELRRNRSAQYAGG